MLQFNCSREEENDDNLLELAKEISLTSFGSSHTLFLPQPRTEAASLFCNLRDTIAGLKIIDAVDSAEIG